MAIKIENIETFGFDVAVRGMRNPMNSWDKSDSDYRNEFEDSFCLGENDLALMKKLVKAGSDHRKFMRFITVNMDIIAPLYWWKEFDTYKVGTVRNSCSTMHCIHKNPFVVDDFSHEHLLDSYTDDDAYYDDECCDEIYADECLALTINVLNYYRKKYLATKNKRYWWQMIQLLPSSYNQRATVQLNYEVLRNMYHNRKAHKLDEWVEFCKEIEYLPYSELITGGIE